MPFLMETLLPRGTFLGDRARGSFFGLGNPIGVSIPSYQSMFVGPPVLCVSNECAQPMRADLFDRLRTERGHKDDQQGDGMDEVLP